MTLRARLYAWWSAWKYVAILAVLLAMSLWTNVRQYRAAIEAPFKAELLSKDQAIEDSAALLASARARATLLDAAAERITANLTASSNDYRAAARQRPLGPSCAPGQARIDAVNRAYGAPEK